MARSELGGDGGVCNKGWTKKQTSDPAGNTNLPSPVDCMAYTPVPTHSILPSFLPSPLRVKFLGWQLLLGEIETGQVPLVMGPMYVLMTQDSRSEQKL